ncbi:hypothetical protein [Caballeronia telluris]|uniref:Uncharacterized protein n=1 Tax=Caballeronia telluris TaxID=326475 RepID=A0A158KIS3_9BURK|nr:hypothetical protein [Caballeronia telluris]SAL81046.1 hypothetical protein AWB66_06364 [Caballeronia telluris]
MRPTKAAAKKNQAQQVARAAGLETFAYPCEIHGPEALSDASHGWCLECRSMSVQKRQQKDQRKAQYDDEHRGASRASSAARRLKDLGRPLPAWYDSERDQIEEFYAKCPEGFDVDHSTPLQGKTVCGLHTLGNLAYLPAKFNTRKGRRFFPQSRTQKPLNHFPGGAYDPLASEYDLKVIQGLEIVEKAIEIWQKQQVQKAKRTASRAGRSNDRSNELPSEKHGI